MKQTLHNKNSLVTVLFRWTLAVIVQGVLQFHSIALLLSITCSWSGDKEWVGTIAQDLSLSLKSCDESCLSGEVHRHDWRRLWSSSLPDVWSDDVMWRVRICHVPQMCLKLTIGHLRHCFLMTDSSLQHGFTAAVITVIASKSKMPPQQWQQQQQLFFICFNWFANLAKNSWYIFSMTPLTTITAHYYYIITEQFLLLFCVSSSLL